MNMTEQDYLDYLKKHGFPLDPTLTVPRPGTMDPASPEGVLQSRLYGFATAAGWLFYHTHDSRRSTPGWPDVALAHPDGGPLYLWELKDATSALSANQQRWLEALGRCTHIETGLYRPADWTTIQRLLTQRRY